MAQVFTVGKRDFVIGRKPYIMGILNVTPDSFSDGGRYTDIDKALKHVRKMIDEGADIIDIGGESTRPDYDAISVSEEIDRTCYVIEAIKEHFNIPVSLDTYKWEVAQVGILAGADMINDIWGLKLESKMAEIIAKHKVSCCLMHNRKVAQYGDLVQDVCDDIAESISIAKAAGIEEERIMVDPGIGFAKDTSQCLTMLKHIDKVVELGYPVLLGTSNKSVIGNTLKVPIEERLEGTLATSVYGLEKGCSFFRVHDVKANKRALTMADVVRKA